MAHTWFFPACVSTPPHLSTSSSSDTTGALEGEEGVGDREAAPPLEPPPSATIPPPSSMPEDFHLRGFSWTCEDVELTGEGIGSGCKFRWDKSVR